MTEEQPPTEVPDALQQQAWVWLRMLNAGNVKTWEVEGFKRWLQTSPAHQAAYRTVRERWALLQPLAGEVLRTDAPAARRHRRNLQGRPQGRRAFLGAAGAALAAVAGVAIVHPPGGLWPAPDEWGADLRTATGERRALTVAQSTVTLNTRTSIRQHAGDGQPDGIDLLAGEAAFDLGGDAPFMVAAGPGRTRATAARFEVRYLDGKACVTCIEGSVQVEHPAGTRLLRRLEQTRYDDRSIDVISTVRSAAVSAWRRGELVFDDTPLAEVLADIDRYRPGRIVLMNDGVRDKPVTGSFYVASLERALTQLQHTFGLQARSLPGGLFILS